MTAQEIITAIKTERNNQGMSQERLASLSGVSRVQISKIETGVIVPGLNVLTKLASALKLRIIIEKME